MELTAADYLHTPRGTRQLDLTPRAVYDRAYVEQRYAAIDGRVRELARRRVAVLNAFTGPPRGNLLDYGCGVGAVVDAAERGGWPASGCDVTGDRDFLTPAQAVAVGGWHAVTFFDSLEHLPDPAACVAALGAEWVMVSVPWCHYPERWEWFRGWKHRRPGEHLWHWGADTLAAFFAAVGYREVMRSHFEDEVRANPAQGEPNILSAIYRRR